MLYAIYLYPSGPGLRQTARALETHGIRRSHEAVRHWLRWLAHRAQELILLERASVATVDETAVNVGGRRAWLLAAIGPGRRAVLAPSAYVDAELPGRL